MVSHTRVMQKHNDFRHRKGQSKGKLSISIQLEMLNDTKKKKKTTKNMRTMNTILTFVVLKSNYNNLSVDFCVRLRCNFLAKKKKKHKTNRSQQITKHVARMKFIKYLYGRVGVFHGQLTEIRNTNGEQWTRSFPITINWIKKKLTNNTRKNRLIRTYNM